MHILAKKIAQKTRISRHIAIRAKTAYISLNQTKLQSIHLFTSSIT